jgi:hypothetical protein
MPKLSAETLEAMIMAAVDAASAPTGSAKYRSTPDHLRRLFDEGDQGDAWIVVTGAAETIVQMLQLRDLPCPCGDPDHRAQVAFGFAPIDGDGPPDFSQGLIGDPDETPEGVRNIRPEVVRFAQIVNAEIREDVDSSHRLWIEAVDDGSWVRVLHVALKQAGQVRRQVIAAAGGN